MSARCSRSSRTGCQNKEIARRLGISEKTVKAHLTSVFLDRRHRPHAGRAVGRAPGSHTEAVAQAAPVGAVPKRWIDDRSLSIGTGCDSGIRGRPRSGAAAGDPDLQRRLARMAGAAAETAALHPRLVPRPEARLRGRAASTTPGSTSRSATTGPSAGRRRTGRTASTRSRAGRVHQASARALQARRGSATSATATSTRSSGGPGRRSWPAHRLDVPGLLARPPDRVLFVPGRGRFDQPAAPRRKAAPVRRPRPPAIREIRYAALATPRWTRRPRTTVAKLPQAGRRLNKAALTGKVDVRVRVHDPQSYIGWFSDLPHLAAPHHPVPAVGDDREPGREPRRAAARGVRAEQMLDQPAGPALRAGHRAEPARERLHALPPLDPVRRRLLVPALPAPVLGHDAPPGRALPAPGPRLGRGRQPRARPTRSSRSATGRSSGRSSPSQRTAPGSCRSR